MSVVNGTRITFKRTRPNPLFQDWLEELYEEAQQKGSKLAPMLKEALSSITKYPLPLQSGAECAILKGFDKRLCLFLDKRLEVYTSKALVSDEENVVKPNMVRQMNDSNKTSTKECLDQSLVQTAPKSPISLVSDDENEDKSNLVPQLDDANKSSKKNSLVHSLGSAPKSPICLISDEENEENPNFDTESNSLPSPEPESMGSSSSSEISKSLPSSSSSNSNSSPENKNKRRYMPAFRSGCYAFLMALLDLKKDQTISKAQLVTAAQNYCKTNTTKEWKSMLGLIKRGLVNKTGERNRSLFCLTEAGHSLAKELSRTVGKINGVKNTSFDNYIGNNHVEYKSESEVNDLLFDNNISTNEVFVINDTESKSNGLLNNAKKYLLDDNQCGNDVVVVNNVTEATSTLLNGVETSINDHKDCPSLKVTKSIQDHEDYSNLIVMEPSTFDIVLLIDCHETSGLTKKNDPTVSQFKKYPELKHEYRSLKVGDFTWIARSKINKNEELVLPFVVERKRMDDLGHSIKDGRFHEQKFRLRKCGLNNVIYLVENHGSNKHVGLPMQSLMQALANTRVHDGFKVHITESLVHSVTFLATMTLRLIYEYKDKGLKGHNKEPKADVLMSFEYFNKSSVKNRALSVTDTFIKLLLQLKGVSVEKALTITSVYKTPRLLIEKYKTCEQKEGEMLLANLKFGELYRSVGPSVSKSVYQLFTFKTIK